MFQILKNTAIPSSQRYQDCNDTFSSRCKPDTKGENGDVANSKQSDNDEVGYNANEGTDMEEDDEEEEEKADYDENEKDKQTTTKDYRVRSRQSYAGVTTDSGEIVHQLQQFQHRYPHSAGATGLLSMKMDCGGDDDNDDSTNELRIDMSDDRDGRDDRLFASSKTIKEENNNKIVDRGDAKERGPYPNGNENGGGRLCSSLLFTPNGAKQSTVSAFRPVAVSAVNEFSSKDTISSSSSSAAKLSSSSASNMDIGLSNTCMSPLGPYPPVGATFVGYPDNGGLSSPDKELSSHSFPAGENHTTNICLLQPKSRLQQIGDKSTDENTNAKNARVLSSTSACSTTSSASSMSLPSSMSTHMSLAASAERRLTESPDTMQKEYTILQPANSSSKMSTSPLSSVTRTSAECGDVGDESLPAAKVARPTVGMFNSSTSASAAANEHPSKHALESQHYADHLHTNKGEFTQKLCTYFGRDIRRNVNVECVRAGVSCLCANTYEGRPVLRELFLRIRHSYLCLCAQLVVGTSIRYRTCTYRYIVVSTLPLLVVGVVRKYRKLD